MNLVVKHNLKKPAWAQKSPAHPVNIVIVDDDHDFLELISHQVEQLVSCRLYRAENAWMALAHIQKHPTHILITDTNMPGVNGVDLLSMVKAHNPKIKVIVLFAGLNGSPIKADEILRLGADLVLSKPEIPNRLFPYLKAYAVGQVLLRTLKRVFPVE